MQIYKIITIFCLLAMFVALPLITYGATVQDALRNAESTISKINSTTTGSSIIPQKSFAELAGQIINLFLGLAGTVALIMMIIGGFIWMTAGGDTNRIGLAKKIMIWTVLGLIIILTSYSLVLLLLSTVEVK